MREVIPGPWRGKHPPNISDVSLPLTLRHTHTRTNSHSQSHTHQPTHPPRHTYTYTHTHTTYVHTNLHSQAESFSDRHTQTHTHTNRHTRPYRHTLTLTNTPCHWDSTGSNPGRGVRYKIENRQGFRIIVLSRRVRMIFANTDYCTAKEFGKG